MSQRWPQGLEESDDGGEGSRPSPVAKRPRGSCCFDNTQIQLEDIRNMLQWQKEMFASVHRENKELREKNQELHEKVTFLMTEITRLGGYLRQSPAPRMSSDQNYTTPLQLSSVNSCSNIMYSMRKIEADDHNLLKVAIHDHNNEIIKCEPFSFMRVHIVAIHGDFDDDHEGQWTKEYFKSKIVNARPGKNLLSGNLYIRLQDGVGYLNGAKFLDNSSFVPSKRFRLGVMVADERISERILEGITNSFAVKDIRGFSTKKSSNPSPQDAVYKLNRIGMNGDRHKLLEQKGIKTVEDLLCSYNKSPEDLRESMGKISDKDWDMIISHAQRCKTGPLNYSTCVQNANVSHETESFSRSDGSCYFKGSCSAQPSPTPTIQNCSSQNFVEHLDVQVAQHQISSTYNGLSSGASLHNVPKELDGTQVTNQQVSSVGNKILPVLSVGNNMLEGSSSQGRRSVQHKTIPRENGVVPGNPSVVDSMEGYLSMLQTALLEDESRGDFDFSETYPGGSCNVFEHSNGLSSVNEVRNMRYGVLSAASEVGSVSYGGLSPANEVGSRSYRISPSPVRKASNASYGGVSPASEVGSRSYRISPSPVRKANNASYGGVSPASEVDGRSYMNLHRSGKQALGDIVE
ncbi:unnamed protein product [Urochloa decumbens]|uniref:Uncharacterized protein n=2 Tax=Urochloa decumbens TaxID=240449 RepID=A0ABC8XAM6_9POAL